MIIPMKKVTLLCLASERVAALDQLRRLGLMQIVQDKTPETDKVASLTRDVADAEKAINIIRMAETGKKNHHAHTFNANGSKVVTRTLELGDMRAETQKEISLLQRDEEILAPWGDFSFDSITDLQKKNIFVTLCMSNRSVYEDRAVGKNGKSFPEGATVNVIAQDKLRVHYVLITSAPLEEETEAVKLPARTLCEVRTALEEQKRKLASIDKELLTFTGALPQMLAYQRKVEAALEFAQARDGMESLGELTWVRGFVPETEIDRLRKAALENGWALQLTDPTADDNVPTYIRKPSFLNIMDPLFDFIGVQPGYRENDVNAFFCLFFPLFFGMIIGDAGYAALFLIIAFICKHALHNKPQAKMPLNLFIMLSVTTFIWGWLNGSWFGIPLDVLPGWMRGWSLLADPANSSLARKIAESTNLVKPDMTDAMKQAAYNGLSDKFVQYICFLLAALHLGSARVFKFFDEIKHSWLAIGHLGWACLIIANFFLAVDLIVFRGTFPATLGYSLYGIGFLLIVATVRGTACLNLPFALTGSFVDVLSYIRLFAVGLSGAYIAENFNKMGMMLLGIFPGYWIIAGAVLMVLVILAGHLLNIALGFLSVMVHGIRLNTLEFSNHVEMQWAGAKFRPFANPENTETNNIQS